MYLFQAFVGKEGLVSYFPGKMILVPYFIGASSNEMHYYSMVEVRYTPRYGLY